MLSLVSSPDAEAFVELEGRYDLRATLRRTAIWGSDPTLRLREGEVWIAFRTHEGPACVRYVARDAGVGVSAWGPGAGEAVRAAPDHLGANDPTWTLEVDHPIAGPLVAAMRGVRFGRTRRLMERLVPVIIAQKVTSEGASRSFRELVWRYGERAPGPADLWLAPSPERLRELAYFDLHPLGIERRRAETILFVARRARRLDALAELDAAEAHARLLALPGVGPWTAGLVTSAVHGDTDALPIGDYHIPNHVTYAFTGEARGDDARMIELLEPFRPHRGRVLAAVLRGGPSAPRFGPRLPVRDIRGS